MPGQIIKIAIRAFNYQMFLDQSISEGISKKFKANKVMVNVIPG